MGYLYSRGGIDGYGDEQRYNHLGNSPKVIIIMSVGSLLNNIEPLIK
jgi:hypothetical protein